MPDAKAGGFGEPWGLHGAGSDRVDDCNGRYVFISDHALHRARAMDCVNAIAGRDPEDVEKALEIVDTEARKPCQFKATANGCIVTGDAWETACAPCRAREIT